MKFCADHWQSLRDEIDRVGLTALVPENGEDAARAMNRELIEGPSVDSFDPLMLAHWMIVDHALSVCNQNRPDGEAARELMGAYGTEWCPICYLNAQHRHSCTDEACTFTYDDWTARAADDTLASWKALRGSDG